jgi:heme a synthase
LSPRAFGIVATVAVWALALTILSGAAVRLTGSGLGCPDWPSCTRTSLVAPLQFHAWVEFGNRVVNALVTVASLGALAAALLRAPRRRDLTLLAGGLVVGLFAEVVVGGLTVEHKLAPGFVTAHFLLAIVFLADAVVLQQRSRIPDDRSAAPREPLVERSQLLLSRLLLLSLATVITLGTVVTSTGPHGGDPAARRFDLSLHSVARLHGTAVEVFAAIAILTLWNLGRTGAPRPVLRRGQWMLAALLAQAAVGYTQYFNGDPVALVAAHVAGASLLVIAAIRFHLGLWVHAEAPTVPNAAPDPAPTLAAAG